MVNDSTLPPGQQPFHRTIRSFVLRTGRTTAGQAKAFADVGPRFLLPYTAQPMDLAAAFERQAPTILEIGFGMGEATAQIAAIRPQDNFLCCEVHTPGVWTSQHRKLSCGSSAAICAVASPMPNPISRMVGA